MNISESALSLTPRIVLLNDAMEMGPTETHLLALARSFISLEVDIAIATPPRSDLAAQCRHENIPILSFEKSLLPINILAVRSLIRRRGFNIVHAHQLRLALLATIAARAQRPGHPCAAVVTRHYIEPCFLQRRNLKAKFEARAHRFVDAHAARFIVRSDAARTASSCRGESAPARTITIDYDAVAPLVAARATLDVYRDALMSRSTTLCTAH